MARSKYGPQIRGVYSVEDAPLAEDLDKRIAGCQDKKMDAMKKKDLKQFAYVEAYEERLQKLRVEYPTLEEIEGKIDTATEQLQKAKEENQFSMCAELDGTIKNLNEKRDFTLRIMEHHGLIMTDQVSMDQLGDFFGDTVVAETETESGAEDGTSMPEAEAVEEKDAVAIYEKLVSDISGREADLTTAVADKNFAKAAGLQEELTAFKDQLNGMDIPLQCFSAADLDAKIAELEVTLNAAITNKDFASAGSTQEKIAPLHLPCLLVLRRSSTNSDSAATRSTV